jgi:hypothetical protein
MTQLDRIVRLLKTERDGLSKQMRGITAALSAFGSAFGKRIPARRQLSVAGRARIAEAQRKRWAKVKGNRAPKKTAVAQTKKRTLSAAARKRIAAAQRARWVKLKAEKESA